MRTLKILHTADLHLDSPFSTLNDDKAKVKRAELRQLPVKIAELAASERVDLVLLCGDIFDSNNVYRETVEIFKDALSKITVPVFITPGNHDYFSKDSVYARETFPDNVYIFSRNRIELVDFSDMGFRIFGAGYRDRFSSPLLDGFCVPLSEDVYNIMMLHGVLGDQNSPYAPVTESQISSSGMDYIAFGHVHNASGLKQAGNTFYSYPGCPQGRGFDETGEKTVSIIELEGAKCTLKTVPVSKGHFESLSVNISGKDVRDVLKTVLPESAVNDVYRVILKGECKEKPDCAKLHAEFSECFFDISFIDETEVRQNLFDGADEKTLRGFFISKMKAMYELARTEQERDEICRALRWGIAAMDMREEVSGDVY